MWGRTDWLQPLLYSLPSAQASPPLQLLTICQGQKPPKLPVFAHPQGDVTQSVTVPSKVLIWTVSFRFTRLHINHFYTEIRGETVLIIQPRDQRRAAEHRHQCKFMLSPSLAEDSAHFLQHLVCPIVAAALGLSYFPPRSTVRILSQVLNAEKLVRYHRN